MPVNHDIVSNKFFAARGNPRPALRTHAELAEEFGLSVAALRAELAYSHSAPKPVMRHKAAVCHKTFYEPNAMRAWWKLRQAEKAAK